MASRKVVEEALNYSNRAFLCSLERTLLAEVNELGFDHIIRVVTSDVCTFFWSKGVSIYTRFEAHVHVTDC